jgi:membrane-associated phospholipid phosphatase
MNDGSQIPSLPPPRRPIVDRRARLMAGLATALGLVCMGLALVLRQANGTTVDVAITRGVQWIENPAFSALMAAVSAVGYAPWSWLVLGCSVVALVVMGFYREVPFVLATEGAGMLVASIKLLVERPRPTGDSIRVVSAVLDYSFPSGHVVGYTCLYGFLFFLVYVLFKRSWPRTVTLVALGAMVGLVGISRIHLGHHWASDVLGGYALGTAYLLILVEAYRLLVIRPRSTTTPPAPIS